MIDTTTQRRDETKELATISGNQQDTHKHTHAIPIPTRTTYFVNIPQQTTAITPEQPQTISDT